MQPKRRDIIDILKRRSCATVEELSRELGITSVTVRHHLDVLRSQGFIADPIVRHRNKSGRPQHVYSLTRLAEGLFPHNYRGLAEAVLDEIKSRYDSRQVNVIFEGAAARLAADAPREAPGTTVEARLDQVIAYLNEQGYVAHWDRTRDGYLITTCNCPFNGLVASNPELCRMDLNFVSSLAGAALQRVCHKLEGDNCCAYLLKIE